MRITNAFFPSIFFLLCLAGMKPAGASDSAYTKIDLDACKPVEQYELGGRWLCPGFDGIAVHFAEGDLRIFMSYGPGGENQPAMRVTPPFFNNVKGPIEWRFDVRNGRRNPYATILRFFIDRPDSDTDGQVLIVTRLGGDGVCHIGYVDARALGNANQLARDIADTKAASFICGRDKPVFLGSPGTGPENFWEASIR